jgi:D-alanine-D-alanine ligase-like ATP-grasp enzyme
MDKKSEKDTIAFVMGLRASAVTEVRNFEKVIKRKLRILYIQDKNIPMKESVSGYDEIVLIDFSSSIQIEEALLPYQNNLLAITCTNDDNIARFAKIIPNVPYLRTPTTESLIWSTDKYEMRRRFRAYDSTITPKFTQIKDNSKEERQKAMDRVGFPMIVKPTNLGASLFVQVCYHEDELKKALTNGFQKIKKAYEHDNRLETPRIIAEQFVEGDMYSIDSYVDSRGKVHHCPLVRVKTGKDIGRKDFYGYLQVTPTILKPETIERAKIVAEKAIRALGLRSCSAHTELIKQDIDWKVVEVGPRIGGARDELYKLSCDIEHSLNDIRIRIPQKPVIPKKCKGFAAYMKWFSDTEGIIIETKGIKKIEQLESFHKISVKKKVGDKAVFASNGGRAIFLLYLYNADRARLLADIRRIEEMVSIKVEKKPRLHSVTKNPK